MTEATCRREIELEIPADKVQKAADKITRDIIKVARIPGFRPGKAPMTLVRRRFADDIQGEVVQSLVPEALEKALGEKNLIPVTRPEVDKVEFKDGEPLKFRAVFEVLPEFELGDYKNLTVQVDEIPAGDTEVDKAVEEMRERAATFVPVEGRAAKDGDSVLIKLKGLPTEGGEPVEADNVMVPLGAEETLASFTENLRGANAGEAKTFQAKYPDDYPDAKLAGKTYDFTVEVQAIKEKKRPELNDDFVKEAAGENAELKTLDELRKKIRESIEASRDHQQKTQAQDRILEQLTKAHDFPVPEALIEGQMDTRLERMVRTFAAQGIDPRGMNVDWAGIRGKQRDRAITDVKAELILDRIATAEKIDTTDEEVEKEIEHLAEHRGESATAMRARLTKEGTLDTMKSKLRSNKTIDWLYSNARIEKTAKSEK
ncbi:MAG TPA: trigger factor [Candidatus Acidoferrales bacterium]|nr:trigger factor [Candidatus Acidoferrales bacterium]